MSLSLLFQVDSVAGPSAGEPDPDNPFSRRGEVKKGHGKSKVTFENFEYIKVSNLRRVMMMNDEIDRSMGSPTVLRPFLMRLP